MTTVFKEAQKMGIKNRRLLSIAGRIVLEWYREWNPDAIGKTESTEIVRGKPKTFIVVGYPENEAVRIQLIIQETKRLRRGNKSKNSNRRNGRS